MSPARNRTVRNPSELTPEARVERATRQLAQAVGDLVEATLARGSSASDWADQHHSPLTKATHLRLARTGKLPSRKLGKRVLIRRDALNAYIEREGLARGKQSEDEEVDDILEQVGAGGRA